MDFLMARTKVRSNTLRCMSSCCTLLVGLLGWSLPLFADLPLFAGWREEIGYTKLVNVLGSSLPLGAGVPISLVEAEQGSSDTYFPDSTLAEFDSASDPLGIGATFIDGSGGRSKGISSHASTQANNFMGNTTSLAPAANQVTVYEANDYLNDVLNMVGSNTLPPDTQNFRVQSFSWIGTFVTDSDNPTTTELNNDREALRRFDYAINVNNITALVGLNSSLSPLPHLLSHSYNSIAIGRSDGIHSSGLTTLVNFGEGRSKPDLVAPATSTSSATSMTSSVAAFLHSADTVQGTDAANTETMKAILLAGASKEGVPAWSQLDAGGTWHPLDDTYGAGEVNAYNSYLITLGGQTHGNVATATSAGSHGWDYGIVQPGANNKLLYDFVIPEGSSAEELSVVLAWNAEISAPFHTGSPVVANLDLELVDSSGSTVDFDLNDNIVEGLSASGVDNVEHLFLTDLAAGTYTLKVSSQDLASNFGLAWRTATLFETPSADLDADGDVDGGDFLAWQRGNGTLVGGTPGLGDADGDGDVDSDDLVLISAGFGGGPILQPLNFSAVPEPGILTLAGTGVLLYAWKRFAYDRKRH